jgi:hypothetical protein
MASPGVPLVLALEVQGGRKTSSAQEPPRVDSEDGGTDSPWGEEHIANELKLKLGIRVSLRTVQKYLAGHRGRTPDPSQRWLTFVHNHAHAIVACDFFVVSTARFRILYVFVIMSCPERLHAPHEYSY